MKYKFTRIALAISGAVNLALLGWLLIPLPPQPVIKQHDRAAFATPDATNVTAPISATAEPAPFRWEQLYSPDYYVYVKNLRTVGCPVATLRAIVAADVHAVFQKRAAKLELDISNLGKAPWSTQVTNWDNGQKWKAELQQLPEAETAMVAEYLGEDISAATAAHQTAATRDDHQPLPVVAPLIAQPVDLTALNLDSSQLQAIKDLQLRFLQEIGGPGQDPRDPAYQARWRAAQAETDSLMQGLLGDQAYQDYQNQAFAKAAAIATLPPASHAENN